MYEYGGKDGTICGELYFHSNGTVETLREFVMSFIIVREAICRERIWLFGDGAAWLQTAPGAALSVIHATWQAI